MKPGMYKVVAVVFGTQRPTLQLLVNGEVVLRGGSLSAGMGQHTAARAHVSSSSSAEQPAFPCVMTDYVMLPPSASLTLLYHPRPGSGLGFLKLRKVC